MRLLYVSRDRSGHDKRFVDAWLAAGVEVEVLAASDAPSETASLDFENRVRATIAKFAPDVVQAGPVTDIAAAVIQTWAGPLIAASWGFDLMRDIERDHLAAAQANEVIHRADVVLVDNDGPRSKAIALGAAPEAIVQFPWGVNLDDFRPDGDDLRDRLGWNSGEFIVLSTRSHEPIYDLPTVIAGFAEAAATIPQLRLLVAGRGSLTSSLSAQVEAAGLADQVLFLGNVGQHELPSLYRTADVYVSASVVDGTSVSLLEAMACGTPVCVSRIVGNRQWVTPHTGFDFALGSATELAQRIQEIVGQPMQNEVANRVEAARGLVQREADWSDAPRRLCDLARVAQSRNTVARNEWIRS